jgi:hypothetical protein
MDPAKGTVGHYRDHIAGAELRKQMRDDRARVTKGHGRLIPLSNVRD